MRGPGAQHTGERPPPGESGESELHVRFVASQPFEEGQRLLYARPVQKVGNIRLNLLMNSPELRTGTLYAHRFSGGDEAFQPFEPVPYREHLGRV